MIKRGDIMLESTKDYFQNTFSYPECEELNMYYCGKRIETPNHSYGPEVRSHFLLVLVKEGYGTYLSSKEKVRLSPGKLIVMFPNEIIHYVVDKKSLWSIAWIGVYGSMVYSFFKKMGITPKNPVFDVGNIDALSNVLEEIYQKSFSEDENDKIYIISLLYRFFSHLLSESNQKTSMDFVAETKNIIEYNYDKNINVKSIANSLHVNPCYLSRKFKDRYGVLPKEYILDIRLDNAKRMLKKTNLRINEIASSVGFADSLYFSRFFKEKTGMNPTDYKKFSL